MPKVLITNLPSVRIRTAHYQTNLANLANMFCDQSIEVKNQRAIIIQDYCIKAVRVRVFDPDDKADDNAQHKTRGARYVITDLIKWFLFCAPLSS